MEGEAGFKLSHGHGRGTTSVGGMKVAGFSHRTFLSGGAVVAAVGPRTPKGHAATEFERPLAIEAAKSASSASWASRRCQSSGKRRSPELTCYEPLEGPQFVSPCLATNPWGTQIDEIADLIKSKRPSVVLLPEGDSLIASIKTALMYDL